MFRRVAAGDRVMSPFLEFLPGRPAFLPSGWIRGSGILRAAGPRFAAFAVILLSSQWGGWSLRQSLRAGNWTLADFSTDLRTPSRYAPP